MILGVDVGNTHLRIAVLKEGSAEPLVKVNSTVSEIERLAPSLESTLSGKLRQGVVISSVAPSLNSALEHLFQNLGFRDIHFASLSSPTEIHFEYDSIGMDRVMAAVGARAQYPERHLILIDMGTATTVGALRADGRFLGGVIFAGLKSGLWALSQKTEQLTVVDIRPARSALGRSTDEALALGAYFEHLYALRGFVAAYQKEVFEGERALVLGTGGLASYFLGQDLFDVIKEDLILTGLSQIAKRLGYYGEV